MCTTTEVKERAKEVDKEHYLPLSVRTLVRSKQRSVSGSLNLLSSYSQRVNLT